MVCDGPDPIENNPEDLSPPPRHDLIMNGNNAEDSDDNENDYFGYEPLPQGPETVHIDNDSDEETVNEPPAVNVPPIENMETVLTRDVWSTPRQADTIQMDNERAQQVMSAMANFTLPLSSIPEWAQSITEEQWKQTLKDRIDTFKSN